MAQADPCTACGAPALTGRERCLLCEAMTVMGDRSDPSGQELRELVAAHRKTSAAGRNIGHNEQAQISGRSVPRIRVPWPDEFEAEPAEGKSRVQRLWTQLRSGHRSIYDLTKPPAGCRSIAVLDSAQKSTYVQLLVAFVNTAKRLRAHQKAPGAGGVYRQAAQQSTSQQDAAHELCWLAHYAVILDTDRELRLLPRPLLEHAYELLSDPGWRQVLLCELASLATADGDLDDAERWLAQCDPEPPWLELDSLWRLRSAAVHARRRHWARVLETLGESHEKLPVALPQQVAIGLYRVAALEGQQRCDDADRQLTALVDTHLVVDIKAAMAEDHGLAPAKKTWQLLETRWEDEARRIRRKRQLRGLVFVIVGVVLAPLAVLLFFNSTENRLVCDADPALLEAGGEKSPAAGPSSSSSPSAPAANQKEGSQPTKAPRCVIIKTLVGTPREQSTLTGLLGAQITLQRSQKSTTSSLVLTTDHGPFTLGSCTDCQAEVRQKVDAINRFIRQPRRARLTVQAPGTNLGPFVGVAGMLLGLGLIAFGIGTILRASFRKSRPG